MTRITDTMTEAELDARHNAHSRKVAPGFRTGMRVTKRQAWPAFGGEASR